MPAERGNAADKAKPMAKHRQMALVIHAARAAISRPAISTIRHLAMPKPRLVMTAARMAEVLSVICALRSEREICCSMS